jgi:hypothetical protein
MVDDNLPFFVTFLHHLQKTRAEPAFRVELKASFVSGHRAPFCALSALWQFIPIDGRFTTRKS